MQDKKIFDRVEKKYLIDETVKNHILEQIIKHMERDHYHQSKVFNIYFDTNNYDLTIQSIEQPPFKEKLRARSYGGYDKVFIEIKTKLMGKENNLGYKRRILLTKKEYNSLVRQKSTAVELISQNAKKHTDVQIAKEVDYLIEHFNLKPKILVYYDRESYVGEDRLRITFDENLKYRDKNLKFTENNRDKHYFKTKKNIIMEIKAQGVLPLWLVKLLSAEHAYPQQFSKVGHIYTSMRKEQNV